MVMPLPNPLVLVGVRLVLRMRSVDMLNSSLVLVPTSLKSAPRSLAKHRLVRVLSDPLTSPVLCVLLKVPKIRE